MTTLLLALAGGLGAVTRFVFDAVVARHNPFRVPLGTIVINVTGSFVLGLVSGLLVLSSTDSGGDVVKAVVGTGFCGGYTTFSTASVEAARLWTAESASTGLRYAAVTLVGSVAAAAAGLGLAGLLV